MVFSLFITASDLLRKEENPFSFKHFLNKDTHTSYNLSGARPKVYSPVRMSSDNVNSPEMDGVYPRNPTELPDFVQDHLVIEQCYLNHEESAPLVTDIDNLPDFTLNNVEQRQLPKTHRTDGKKLDTSSNLPFDLTGGLDRHNHKRSTSRAVGSLNPLRNVQGFPFDLPLPVPGSNRIANLAGPTHSPSNDVTSGNKSLPDFLNDGPIRNRATGQPSQSFSTMNIPEHSDRSVRHLFLKNQW